MFIVVVRDGSNFSIKDTSDGVVETYTSEQIAKILKMGIDIKGFSIKDNRLVYNDTTSDAVITKRKILTGYDTIIFTEEDTNETARNKIQEVKQGAKIYVINNSNITDMSDMFYECKSSEIDLSSFDTSKVTNMAQMFKGCKASEIDISSFDTSKVNNMYCMFYNCKQLISLDVSSFNTCNVKSMSYMFTSCRNLKYLNISNFSSFSIEDMDGMFEDCNANIILPKTGKLAKYRG